MSVSTTAIEMARKNQLHRFKLVLLGESGVGKTALVVRFVKNSFSDKFDSTIGGLLFLPTFWVDEKEQQLKPQQVKLEIWDTAGQERYRSITPMYIRGARAAIVVYDITNWNSFLQAKTWVEFLRNTQLSYLDNQRVVIAFVGNKMDLADERREVDRREAESYAAGNDLIFMESSAKSSLNVQELFHKIGQSLLKKERLRMAEEDEAKSGGGAGTGGGGARRSRNINGTEGGRGGGGGLGGIVLSRVEAEWQGARQQMQQNGCCS